jgi:hypothetical protein
MAASATDINRCLFPVLLVVAVSVAGTGCGDFFSPREGEEPEGPPPFQWIDPTSPQNALENFQNSYIFTYLPYYMQTLDTSFMFYPHSGDTIQAGGEFDDWDLEVERLATWNMFTAVDTGYISLALDEIPDREDETSPADTTFIWREYEIGVPGSALAPPHSSAKGWIYLHMIERDGLWYIDRWKDERSDKTGEYDWGQVKLEFKITS